MPETLERHLAHHRDRGRVEEVGHLGAGEGRAGQDPPVLVDHQPCRARGELRELRCHYGPELYRVLYRRSRNLFVLLHILRKDTGKLPRGDIELAKKRWADFKERVDAERRVPPRPAGQDAP